MSVCRYNAGSLVRLHAYTCEEHMRGELISPFKTPLVRESTTTLW